MRKNKVDHSLYFDQCILCRAPCDSRVGFCPACLKDLPWLGHHCHCCALPLSSHLQNYCAGCMLEPPYYQRIYAPFSYQFPLDQLIGKVKYSGQASLIGPLALQLAQILSQPGTAPFSPPDLLIPVPMHPKSLAQRGFNQAALIASVLGKSLDIPCDNRSLRKTHETRHQRELDKAARRKNLSNAFQCHSLEGKSVAIVDDVLTTGSTVHQLCELLLDAGLKTIDIYCICRTPEPSSR